MSTTTTLMTAEEFYDWANRPENADRWCELDGGRIVEVPRPNWLHGTVCGLIAMFLGAFITRRGKGQLCTNDTGLILSRDPASVRGPDIMLFDRLLVLDEIPSGWADEVPALVVEVWSPTDRPGKVQRKITQYLRRGVPLVWLVDPDVRTVTVYRSGKEPVTLDEADELTGEDALPDLRLTVADLFRVPAKESLSS